MILDLNANCCADLGHTRVAELHRLAIDPDEHRQHVEQFRGFGADALTGVVGVLYHFLHGTQSLLHELQGLRRGSLRSRQRILDRIEVIFHKRRELFELLLHAAEIALDVADLPFGVLLEICEIGVRTPSKLRYFLLRRFQLFQASLVRLLRFRQCLHCVG